MTEEHTNYLFDNFPKLYQPDPKLQNNLMAFGFECGDGWFEIIKELSEKLNQTENPPYVEQVKEKFGELRFYVASATDEQYALIEEAEEKAVRTCEICGSEGKLRTDSCWFVTLCDKCNRKK